MTNPSVDIRDLTEQFLGNVRASQQAVVDAVRGLTERTPVLPAWPVESAGASAQVIDSVFDFAGDLLKLQRDFALKLVSANGPGDQAR